MRSAAEGIGAVSLPPDYQKLDGGFSMTVIMLGNEKGWCIVTEEGVKALLNHVLPF